MYTQFYFILYLFAWQEMISSVYQHGSANRSAVIPIIGVY